MPAFGPRAAFSILRWPLSGPQDLVDLFEAEGVATKVEETGKVFPVSNKAADVLAALVRRLERSGATLASTSRWSTWNDAAEGWRLITPATNRCSTAKLIVTTGGQSYPGCGTTGDGYRWARSSDTPSSRLGRPWCRSP